MNAPLEDAIAANLAQPAPASVVALGEALRRRFGSHALAVLFYGSCRRANDDTDGIVDLYVQVDDYGAAYRHAVPAFFNRILAPNVYYLETSVAGRTARAKCAVVSLDGFERGTARWFHSYLWGRFAQPCGLLYAADASVRARVVRAIGQAVATFAAQVLPALPPEFDAEALWTQGLLLTYAVELRSEPPERIRALYANSATELRTLTDALSRTRGWDPAAPGRHRNPSSQRDRSSSLDCGSARGRRDPSLAFERGLP